MRPMRPHTEEKRANRMELVAPAGDPEKLRIAVAYGADAVYFGGRDFSLRAGAGNFSVEEMHEGVSYAHAHHVKCYLAANIYAHEADMTPLATFLEETAPLGLDAYLVSDPGVLALVRRLVPGATLHLSTQANTTNHEAARFWYEAGVRRIVLARELSLPEIAAIRREIPPDMELEAFVHGAMCMAYSGRCLLSNYLTGRDANRGACAHPCRWRYTLMEEKRPGEAYPIEEDGRGSYILSAGDLCMLAHIPQLLRAGVTAAKIEGRNKSIFYLASLLSAYRKAIDACLQNPDAAPGDPVLYDPAWMDELLKASHRRLTTGFYFGQADAWDVSAASSNADGSNRAAHTAQADPCDGSDISGRTARTERRARGGNPDGTARTGRSDASASTRGTGGYERPYTFVGLVRDYDAESGLALVEQRNRMKVGEEIEIMGPGVESFSQRITALYDAASGAPLSAAPHAQQLLLLPVVRPVGKDYMLRRRDA